MQFLQNMILDMDQRLGPMYGGPDRDTYCLHWPFNPYLAAKMLSAKFLVCYKFQRYFIVIQSW